MDLLLSLLVPRSPVELQLAAFDALARSAASDLATRLLPGWNGHSPRVRHAMLDLLLGRPAWAAALLDHAASTPAFAGQIDTPRRAALMGHKSEAVRRRARDLFGRAIATSREAIVGDYSARLRALGGGAGDPTRGRAVFIKHCAVCHRLQGAGNAIGPDLAALTVGFPSADGSGVRREADSPTVLVWEGAMAWRFRRTPLDKGPSATLECPIARALQSTP